MPVVRPGSPARVTLAFGQALVATADAGSVGYIGPHRIRPGAPIKLGRPGDYTIEADTGSVAYEIREPLADALENGARNVQSARVIQQAIIEGNKMALSEKFARLAARTKEVPAALDRAADAALSKFDAVEQRGDAAFAKMAGVVADAEQGVAAAEDAVNQLTNGG